MASRVSHALPEVGQAVTDADRLRPSVEIGALCADLDDFDWILRDDPSDAKGFCRVDRQLPFRERQTGPCSPSILNRAGCHIWRPNLSARRPPPPLDLGPLPQASVALLASEDAIRGYVEEGSSQSEPSGDRVACCQKRGDSSTSRQRRLL